MKMKKIITSMLALSLATTTLISTPHTHLEAASRNKLSLSAKKLTLTVGASKSVSANQTVSWKLSNRKIVQIKKLSNKKLKLTGKTAGKCILTAYKGKTKKTLTVIVKAGSSAVASAAPVRSMTPATGTAPAASTAPASSTTPAASATPNVATATPMVSATPVQQGSTQIPTGIPGTANPTFPSTEVPTQTAITVPTIAATNTTPTTTASSTQVVTQSATPESITATPISCASGPSFSPSVATTTSCATCTPSMEPTETPVYPTEEPAASTEPVEMTVTNVNENSVELHFCNHFDFSVGFGYNFTLEKKENGYWREVPKRADALEQIPNLYFSLEPGEEKNYDVPVTFEGYFNSLPSGTYRISTQVHATDAAYRSNEYPITSNATFQALADGDVILEQYNYQRLSIPNYEPNNGLYVIKNETDLSKIFKDEIPDDLKELDFTSNHVYTQLVTYSSGSYSLTLDGAILVNNASAPYVLFDYTTKSPSYSTVTCDEVFYILYAIVPVDKVKE